MADQMVQVGHACLEAGQRFAQPAGGNNLVVLQVPSRAEFLRAIETLNYHGIQSAVFLSQMMDYKKLPPAPKR